MFYNLSNFVATGRPTILSAGPGTANLSSSYMQVSAALILLVMLFAAGKSVQKRLGSEPCAALFYISARGFISAGVLFAVYCAVHRELPVIRVYSLIMACLLALCACAYTMLGFRIMKIGSLSVFTAFLMLGGMIVPYLYGVFRLNEPINAARIAGIVIMSVSMFLPLTGGRKSDRTGEEKPKTKLAVFCLLCVLVFLLNGSMSVISKVHAAGVLSFESSDPLTFAMLGAICSGVISTLIYAVLKLFGKRETGVCSLDTVAPVCEPAATEGKGLRIVIRVTLLFIVPAAVFDGFSSFLFQRGAASLPASVMYPIVTGGSIVLTALADYLLFREKPTKIALAGLIITFASTFLFLL